MDYTDKIIFIHKHLSGELSPEERVGFDVWINEHPDNKNLFDQVSAVWQNASVSTNIKFDAEKAYLKHLSIIEEEKPQLKIVKTNIFSLNWVRVAAAITVLALAALFVFDRWDNAKLYHAEGTLLVHLEDGSDVWLEKGSRLKVSTFNDKHRKVALTGKAYFDVAKNDHAPFEISADGMAVTVLGTKFIVDEKLVKVSVRDGKVAVKYKESDVVLTKNQAVHLQDEKPVTIQDISFEKDALWFNEDLSFDKAPFDQVIRDISYTFNVQFELPKNKDWSVCTFSSGPLKNNTLDQILMTLQLTYDLQYVKQNDHSIKISSVKCK